MRVAMLTYSTRARGGVAHALKLSERLRRDGVEIKLFSLARSDDASAQEGYYRDVSVPFEILTYEWHSDLVTRLEKMIDAYSKKLPRDADIYHSQDCVGGTALARMKAEGLISAPVFRTIHHIDDFAEPSLFEFEKKAVAHADHRFVVSRYWKKVLKESYGFESTITYNGIDIEDFRDVPRTRASAPTILFVGGLEPRKGLEFLMLAMQRIAQEIPDVRLISVAKTGFRGTDDVGWFKVLANRCQVDDKIEFYESVSEEKLKRFYGECDLLVLPSRNEGWGLSLMEAMACGKPVVATKVGGVPELVRHNIEGLLVDPCDVKGLARAIVRLLKDPELRVRLGTSGTQRVQSFSWDRTARVVRREYKRALHSALPKPSMK